MSEVQVLDKTFKTLITKEKIQERIKEIATQINEEMKDKNPLFLAILNGSFIFAADLCRHLTINHEISFIKLASYEGTSSTGAIKQMIGLNSDMQNRHVIILEDIIDTGLTMKYILEQLTEQSPASIQICTLLHKPANQQVPMDIKYIAFNIPNDFVVGYGLDYNQQGRNLNEIYTLKK
ncbi:MAG: hypoxanthine phosphoribosyltransferase [Prevotella sp.]|nr:hypoxanthine phosphoribosyltransferase [Candidatus Equicola stercoris]